MTDISQQHDRIRLIAGIGECWSPSLSPDNTQIAFISNLAGFPQAWRIPITGGFPERVTAIDDYVTKVSWSPDGEWLAVEAAPGGGMNTQIYIVRPDGTGLRQLTVGGLSNNWLGIWEPDNTALIFSSNMDHPESMDCYQVDIDSGTVSKITSNSGTGRVEGRTEDGKILINRVEYRGDNNLLLADPSTNQETCLTPHQPPANFSNLKFSDDEGIVYLISNRDNDFSGLAHYPIEQTKSWTYLCTRDDAELNQFVLSPDKSQVALTWNVAGRTELELFSMDTTTSIATIDLPSETANSLQYTKDGQTLIMCVTGSNAPSDIWALDLSTYEFQQLTFSPHAGVNLDKLVVPTLEVYEAHDNVQLSGWLYSPLEVYAPFPIVLSFHGGPEGQDRPIFRADYQALLSQGIGVFAPNVRGSSGFGKTFLNLDNGALRVDAIQDIKATADYLIEQDIAMAGKIGIMGGSYGGYMTMAGLAEFPNLFAAGVNIYGVVNFKTFFDQTEPWMASISKIIYGDPATEGDMLDELSPLTNIQDVIAPTLVIHGANDTNVPVYEAEQVVQKLQEQGVPVNYILFPDEGHGFKNEPNRITAISATVNCFMQYLGDIQYL